MSDIRIKPFNQKRIQFLLRKCHAIDGDGNRVGEKKRLKIEDKERQRFHKYSNNLWMQVFRRKMILQEEILLRT